MVTLLPCLWHAPPYPQACHSGLANLGGSVTKCETCGAATYCSQSCRQAHAPVHRTFCLMCQVR